MSAQNVESPETPVNMDKNLAVAIYPTHIDADAAIKQLVKSGFDMRKLSIVGKDYHTSH